MFKSKKSKAGFGEEPSTPKFHSVLLPEIGEGGNCGSPHPTTSWFAALLPSTPRPTTPRSTTPRPTIVRAATPQPSAPLKPCLKMTRRTMTTTGDHLEAGQEVSKMREEYVPPNKASPTTRERKFSMTGGGASMTKPKKVTTPHSYTIVPMKPPHLPPVNLHWQLLPHMKNIGKPQLRFDITLPITHICFTTSTYPRPLRKTDLDKAAADEPLEEMIIQCEHLPAWFISIKRRNGICCRDVFEAIFKTYNEVLTEVERRAIPEEQLSRVKAAFKTRCAESPSLYEYEERMGFRRVDLLKGKNIFLGLIRPRSDSNWILKVGRP